MVPVRHSPRTKTSICTVRCFFLLSPGGVIAGISSPVKVYIARSIARYLTAPELDTIREAYVDWDAYSITEGDYIALRI
jgi:hypothetical protein